MPSKKAKQILDTIDYDISAWRQSAISYQDYLIRAGQVIDTALAEARLEGAKAGLLRAARFLDADLWISTSPHYLCENPASAIRALDPQQVINERVKS